MTAAHIYDLLTEVKRPWPKEYEKKQIHPVPEMEVVEDRAKWLVEYVRDKVIVDIGCASGPLHRRLEESAARCFGIDREQCDGSLNAVYDLDITPNAEPIPWGQMPIEAIVCGEVIEHLGNPLQALTRLREHWPNTNLVVTVPNAFSASARSFLVGKSIENVNADHLAWYSWWTAAHLLTRAGWVVKDAKWYHGKPMTAEGLIFVAETG